MTSDNEVRLQRKISERIGLLFLFDRVRKNTRSYNKEKNKKRNTTNHRNKTDTKREYTRKPRTRISKETINISGRQE